MALGPIHRRRSVAHKHRKRHRRHRQLLSSKLVDKLLAFATLVPIGVVGSTRRSKDRLGRP